MKRSTRSLFCQALSGAPPERHWDCSATIASRINDVVNADVLAVPDVESVGSAAANPQRLRPAETIARLLGRMERPNSRFVLTGDMNDAPDSPKPEAPGQGPASASHQENKVAHPDR